MPDIATPLLAWFRHGRRDLPWRQTDDPYAIWVSEIMLQQTQVATVVPYYRRWMARFPDVQALAAAAQTDVLRLWEGLGYYSRARNLHAAAQTVVNELGGVMPADAAGLRQLKGIGRYTAAAIASIAYGEDVAVLDGNVKRVLARVFNVDEDIRSTAGEKRLWALAEAHLPRGQAGDYNQALMELGATVCMPKKTLCLLCPLNHVCEAQRLSLQAERPVVSKRKPTPHYDVAAGIVRRNGDGAVLIAQRPPDKLLGGLWEFPGGKYEPGEDGPAALKRELREELGIEVSVGAHVMTVPHAFTHFRITVYAFEAALDGGEPQALGVADWAWVPVSGLGDYPMGKVDRQIASQLAQARQQQ